MKQKKSRRAIKKIVQYCRKILNKIQTLKINLSSIKLVFGIIKKFTFQTGDNLCLDFLQAENSWEVALKSLIKKLTNESHSNYRYIDIW